MKRVDSFVHGDRYQYDFDICSCANGFAQIDTGQDAGYYGNWINPTDRIVIIFAEGDLTTIKFDNDAEMIEWVQKFKSCVSLCFIGIDPGLGETLRLACVEHGLGPFLH